MKKILLWILILVIVFSISFLYHKSINEDSSSTNYQNDNLNFGVEEDENNIQESLDIATKTDSDAEKLSGDIETKIENQPVNNEEENVADTKIETLAGSYSNLSNKTNAWGFVRKANAVQPELYGPYTKVLDDYEGIYMGNSDDKVIYLTFDEGYENGYTASILDTLKEKNVVAIFFVTMPYVKQNPELIQRMIDEGHFVGNHTVNHPSMPEVTDDEKLAKEITELHDYILQNFNYEMKYLRPPKGEYSERTVKLSLDLGYKTVLWSSAYDDWDRNNQKGAEYAKKMIYNNLHNGSVILLHAVSKDNAEVLGDAIDEIRNRGYEFRTLDEFER